MPGFDPATVTDPCSGTSCSTREKPVVQTLRNAQRYHVLEGFFTNPVGTAKFDYKLAWFARLEAHARGLLAGDVLDHALVDLRLDVAHPNAVENLRRIGYRRRIGDMGHAEREGRVRLESVQNVVDQAACVAKTICGKPAPYTAVPWFWSDQFDARIQYLGRGSGSDDVRIVAGSVEERRFVALYGSHGRLRAALGVSMPKNVMPFRKLLLERATWTDALARGAELGA